MKVADGERYSLGDVTLEFRHTPGHTPESMSIVVYEHRRRRRAVRRAHRRHVVHRRRGPARPALVDRLHPRGPRRQLYDSLHSKLLTLPDATVVFPAHGAGSACGKNLSTELSSTIGDQKATNYAVRAPDKQTFVALVSEGQAPAPGYFEYDAVLNRTVARVAGRIADAGRVDLRRGARRRRRRGDADRRTQPGGVRAGPPAVERSTSGSKVATPSSPDR